MVLSASATIFVDCALLEVVDDPLDLGLGRVVLRSPGDHARRVAVFEGEGVGDGGDLVRIAAKDLDRRTVLAGGVLVAEQVVRGRSGRPLAVR